MLSRIGAVCDMHFNLDNEEYLFTIIEKRKKNNKKRKCVMFTNTFAFCFHLFSCRVCLSVGAKRRHLYQDKHTSNCHWNLFSSHKSNFAIKNYIVEQPKYKYTRSPPPTNTYPPNYTVFI